MNWRGGKRPQLFILAIGACPSCGFLEHCYSRSRDSLVLNCTGLAVERELNVLGVGCTVGVLFEIFERHAVGFFGAACGLHLPTKWLVREETRGTGVHFLRVLSAHSLDVEIA